MDMLEPSVRQSRTENPVDPSLKRPSITPLPEMLKDEPSLPIDLSDIADPIRVTSMIDVEEPNLAIDLTLNELPIMVSPRIENSAPAIALKNSEQDEPM
jgi:hypothetical protein